MDFGIVGGLLTAWLAPRFLAGHLGWTGGSPCRGCGQAATMDVLGRYIEPRFLVGVVAGWFLIGPVNAVLGWFFRGFNRVFELGVISPPTAGRSGRCCAALSLIVLVVYGGLLGLTAWRVASWPTGFIPTQDQGYLLVNVQLPDSASVQRTDAVRGPHRPDGPPFPAWPIAWASPGNRF